MEIFHTWHEERDFQGVVFSQFVGHNGIWKIHNSTVMTKIR